MKEFCQGTPEQYELLSASLADGMCHVYNNCTLPESCTPRTARLGFERTSAEFIVYVDKGIVTTSADETFRRFLENGEAHFKTSDMMADFFHSLQPLYETEQSVSYESMANFDKLRKIEQEANKPIRINPAKLSAKIKKEIFGQDTAIDCMSEKIAVNLAKKKPSLLCMVLMGSTATGKSDAANSVSDALSEITNHRYGFINVSANEFVGEHTVNRFFGAPPGYVGHGQPTVFEPIRQNPYHVIVINEIEKGDIKILTGLMEAIDTGFISMADNSSPIDMNHCILLFTSNIPVDLEKYKELSPFAKEELCRECFTQKFGYPEIAGKIGNFIAFDTLSIEARTKIILKFICRELENYDLKLFYVEDSLMQEYLTNETKYGARGMRGLVSNSLGRKLLSVSENENFHGKSVRLKGTLADVMIEIVEES